jgi:dipeptidase
VANWAAVKHSYIIRDIKEKQNELELEVMESTKKMEDEALALYRKNPVQATDMLTEYSRTRADRVVEEWWALAWRLVAKYSDGYVNEPGKMAQEVGYPESWYEHAEWKNGPTTYKQPDVIEPGE